MAESNASQVPRLRQGVDLTKLGLSMDEGFVASRIDGRTSVADIAHIVGKPRQETERILERLAKAGIVQLGDSGERDEVEAPSRDPSRDLDYGAFIFPPALMMEACDLSQDERKRIIWFHENLEKWSHYEVLQIRRRDGPKEVKKAYHLRSLEWHPDRFRRPNLGSFRKLIDDIYKRIKDAQAVLSDPDARARYDVEVVFLPDEEEMAEMLERQRRAEREKVREEEAAERRKRRNPVRKRIEQARRLYEEALEKEKKGDTLTALRLVQTAAAFDGRSEYIELGDRLKVSTAEHRIGPYMRRGLHQESLTNWDEAIAAFEEAVRMAPEHGPARIRLAYNMVMGGRDPHESAVHAQKGAGLLPDDPEGQFVLGMCYENGGMEKAALRAYTRALELRPNYVEVKKRLKKLKWGF